MKILDKIAGWVNKLDAKLFGGYDDSYEPHSGKCFIHVLITVIIAGIVLAITQVLTTGESAEKTVETIAGLAILIVLIRDMISGVKAVSGVGKKIGYVFFNLVLATVAFQIAMYAIFLLVILIVGWIIITVISPNKKDNEYEVTYNDGSSEKVKSQRGLMGEETIDTKFGTFDPNDPAYRE